MEMTKKVFKNRLTRAKFGASINIKKRTKPRKREGQTKTKLVAKNFKASNILKDKWLAYHPST